ncbi:MAG: aldo/keto reductase [Theionarchaea archaeon]|nr:aldo/keto reductase [Theionarchaea archaeon]MBU7038778.1 aldo/keto reductase [Theionarchaea archaeon]
MEYSILGKTGIRVSRICLGAMSFGWLLTEEESRPIIEKALDLGITFFDTANVYGRGRSEEILGSVLKDHREDVIIATKVFWSFRQPTAAGLSRPFVFKEVADSLHRLQTDYIDVLYAHRFDPNTSCDDILRTLNILITKGIVQHIGVSTLFAWELAKSLWKADTLGLEPFQVVQPHYNLLYREEEREILPLCRDQKIAVTTWGSLARGVLAGGYSRAGKPATVRAHKDAELIDHWFTRDQDFQIVDRVKELAKEKDCSPAQIALAWILSKREITAPIVGITKVEHLEEAVSSLDIRLSPENMAYLEELYRPRELTGHYSGAAMPGDPRE